MANGFLEVADAELLNWARCFSEKINAGPAVYGLTDEQAMMFAERYAAYATAFKKNQPGVRSAVTVAGKEAARAALLTEARSLSRIIGGQKDVTDEQRISLGLPVRGVRSRARTPEETPVMHVRAVSGHRVTVVVDPKPAYAIGIVMFSYIGQAYPAGLREWQFESTYSRSRFDIDFPESLPPGTQLWLRAQWLNTRLQTGAASLPIMTYLQGGSVASIGRKAA
ncbi:MAG: hypothetical protein QM754_05475 [Tepidisphaeraceae bacterium]